MSRTSQRVAEFVLEVLTHAMWKQEWAVGNGC